MAAQRVLALIAALAWSAHADPPEPPKPPKPPNPPTAEVEREKPERKRFGKLESALTTGALYSAFGTYAYFAWFYEKKQVPFYVISDFRDEGPFALYSYAGGADKWGHAWSNYALTRGTTELLRAGGWNPLGASFAAAGLDLAWFTASEMKDGVTVGFEVGDETMNLAGAALGVVMENVPALDRLFDFRLAYIPSSVYLHLADQMPFHHNGGLDIGQDYTGQSYTLALHLGALPRITDTPWTLWGKYTDLVAGFETRHYSPPEGMNQRYLAHQTFYLGLAVNMQAVLNALAGPSTARTIGNGIFEVYTLPATTVRFAGYKRFLPTAPPPQ
jgi:hypothetical protein